MRKRVGYTKFKHYWLHELHSGAVHVRPHELRGLLAEAAANVRPALQKISAGDIEEGARAVLVVDDNPDMLEIYRKILSNEELPSIKSLARLETDLFGQSEPGHVPPHEFVLSLSQSGQEACRIVQQALQDGHRFALAFVDMRMPGGWDGLQTIERLWQLDSDIQVVICTAYTDYSLDEITGRLGRSSQVLILNKPFEGIEVQQIAFALAEKWRLQREQRACLIELDKRVEQATRQLQQALSQVQHQASHDALTGLPNRTLFMNLLRHSLAGARRRSGRIVTAFIDLDRFKWVNDSLGHNIGDELLQVAARRMSACLRDTDTLARIGGDEFVLLLSDSGSSDDVMRVVTRLMDAVAQPMTLAGREVSVTCSIGCSIWPEHGDDSDALLRYADAAMYRAKEMGGGRVQMYDAELCALIEERLLIETELRAALARGQFSLVYQPQVEVRSGCVDSVEALLRWRHPDLGDIAPAHFIPIAEETGMIHPIGQWVLREACAQGRRWQDSALHAIRIAVNVSARQLAHPEFRALVRQCLDESGLDPARLELEVSESAAMGNPEKTIPLMDGLKELGVSLSIDDFGTGYSNMNTMKQFPMDRLKLDGSFVRSITSDPKSMAIIDAIIVMSHHLGLKVVGEMVETEGQLVSLAKRHCDLAQGFYFSPALTADACTTLLALGPLPVPEQIANPRQERILLSVDDEPHITAALQRELRHEGYRILCTDGIDDAFELLARYPVGVILCDLRLQQSNGIELLSRVKSMYPHTVRLILSGDQNFASATAAINLGLVSKFLTKPWDSNELKAVMLDAFELHERLLQEEGGNFGAAPG